MPWVAPKTDFVNGDVLTATQMNNIGGDLAMLNGGTTGQVLSKASNANGDFAWTSETDPNAIPKTLIDAKGDLISATAADTPARLAVGTDGQYLSADSTAATGLKWVTATSGGMTLLSTVTASAATSVQFASISGSYKHLLLTWDKISESTGGGYWTVRFNNISTASYGMQAVCMTNATTASLTGYATAANTRDSGIGNAQNNAPIPGIGVTSDLANYMCSGSMWLYNYTSSQAKSFEYKTHGRDGANDYTRFVSAAGICDAATSAITQIDFIRSSTQTITGTFRLYGVS